MPVIGSKGKNQMVGMKIATSGKRDGCSRDVSPVKNNPQCPYDNPAKADKTMQGTPCIKGKLG